MEDCEVDCQQNGHMIFDGLPKFSGSGKGKTEVEQFERDLCPVVDLY